jgi:hypothetical protein
MIRRIVIFVLLVGACGPSGAQAQERLKIAYSSADASNTVWFTALDAGIYKKCGGERSSEWREPRNDRLLYQYAAV